MANKQSCAVSTTFDRGGEVIQLHLGGGTPSFMDTEKIATLVDSLAQHFHFHFHLSALLRRDFSTELEDSAPYP